MRQKIKALVFDMDGLLFDSERVVQKSWEKAGEKLGYPGIGQHIYNTLGFNVVRRTEYFRQVFGETFPMEEFNEMTRKIFQEIKEMEGVPLKPGVKEILDFGKGRGWRMAVATSSRREYSLELLKTGGILHYFDTVLCGDMVTKAKPDPEIYEKACSLLHVLPEEAVALEDSPNGIRAAFAAGMCPVMVPDLVEPNEEIKKLYQIKVKTLLEAKEELKKLADT